MDNNKLISIEEFLTNDYYLGKSWKDKEGVTCLLPFWKQQLHSMFLIHESTERTKICKPPQQILLGGAKGIGKSRILNTAIAPYYLYLLLNRYDNEYELQNIAKDYLNTADEKITICFFNRNGAFAAKAKDSFCKTIENSKWFRNKYGTIEKIYRNIDIIAANDIKELEDKAIVCCFMDECLSQEDITPREVYENIISGMFAKCKAQRMLFATAISANAQGEELKWYMEEYASHNPNDLHINYFLEPASYEIWPDSLSKDGDNYLCDISLGSLKKGDPFILHLHDYFKPAAMNRLEAGEFIIPQGLLSKGQEHIEHYLKDIVGLYPYKDFLADTCYISSENTTCLKTFRIRTLKNMTNDYLKELDTLYSSKDLLYKHLPPNKEELDEVNDKIQKIKRRFIKIIDQNIL